MSRLLLVRDPDCHPAEEHAGRPAARSVSPPQIDRAASIIDAAMRGSIAVDQAINSLSMACAGLEEQVARLTRTDVHMIQVIQARIDSVLIKYWMEQ